MWLQNSFILTILIVSGQCRLMDIDTSTVCADKADNTFVRSGTSCHHYMICLNGSVSEEKACPQGEGFVSVNSNCGPLNEAGCRDYLLRSLDASLEADDNVSDANDDENYDSDNSFDEPNHNDDTVIVDYACFGVLDGALVPSHKSCNTYFRCENEVGIEEKCAPELVFNEEQQRCDPKDEVDCLLCTDDGQYLLSDPRHCNQFYYCNNYGRDKYACPNAERFDSVDGYCRPRAEVQCDTANLCHYVNATATNFLVADVNDCRK